MGGSIELSSGKSMPTLMDYLRGEGIALVQQD